MEVNPEGNPSTRVGGYPNQIAESDEPTVDGKLPPSLQAHIERNRQRALLLRQARLIPHPYAKMYVCKVRNEASPELVGL